MHHVMFDVDGTLVESFKFDEECYLDAVYSVVGSKPDNDWAGYSNVTDSGILEQYLAEKGLQRHRDEILVRVKSAFVSNIEAYLLSSPAKQVSGAAQFLSYLRERDDVSLSIATGGWGETALLKLESAGIDTTGVPMTSSNDHFSRTEIMRLALQKAGVPPGYNLNYFGDALWDKQACELLNFNFILVGDRVEHEQAISSFMDVNKACHFLGL